MKISFPKISFPIYQVPSFECSSKWKLGPENLSCSFLSNLPLSAGGNPEKRRHIQFSGRTPRGAWSKRSERNRSWSVRFLSLLYFNSKFNFVASLFKFSRFCVPVFNWSIRFLHAIQFQLSKQSWCCQGTDVNRNVLLFGWEPSSLSWQWTCPRLALSSLLGKMQK